MNDMRYMTWEEFSKRNSSDVLIISFGSTEQHSLHLPLSTDVIIPDGLSLMLADEINGIVAPAVSYGYKSLPSSGGGPLFPGTTSVNAITFINYVKDILSDFIRSGVTKFLLMCGHYENEFLIVEAVDLVSQQAGDSVKFVIASWYDNISETVMNKVFNEVPFPGWSLEHAAIAETSLVHFFRPETVHMDRMLDVGLEKVPTYHKYPVPKNIVPLSGTLHTPRSASKEKGELMANDIVQNLKKIVENELLKS